MPVRNLRQVVLKLRVEGRMKSWVERDQHIMGGLVCRSWPGSMPRDLWEADKVRTERAIDVVDGVVDSSMQDGEVASRMNSEWLGAGSPYDCQKSPVPLD